MRVTINLSPSDLKKEGSHFDLPIALLIAIKEFKREGDFFVFGELGLDGSIKESAQLFPLILSLYSNEKISIIAPKSSYEKLKHIPNLKLYLFENLKECVDFLEGVGEDAPIHTDGLQEGALEIDGVKYFYLTEFTSDFYEVKGQQGAKRAALISAAGFHNILLEGSPGCGKSMIIKRMREILPPMNLEEVLESAKLESLEGKEPNFLPRRPHRAPHHSSTKASIFGGGTKEAKIGEIALCDNGILFFDELPHFGKSILEALREPLEDNKIQISRVNSKVLYKTSFLFAAAQNPCPCGNLLSQKNVCRCTEFDVQRYKNRLSEPFLDRIDLFVQMGDSDVSQKSDITSKEMQDQVLKAFVMQKKRGQKNLNGKLDEREITTYCTLEESEKSLLHASAAKLGISHRGINKILKVARTIADLEESETIQKSHLLEAMRFRRR